MKYNNINIKCRICNRIIHRKALTTHLKHKHKLSFNIYAKECPEEFHAYVAEHINKFQDYIKSNIEKFPDFVKCKVCDNITTGTTCSRSCYSKYKKTQIGILSSRYGTHLTKESKNKIGEKAKLRFKDKKNHPMYGKIHSKEAKSKMSITRLKYSQIPNYITGFKGKKHTPEAIKKIFTHRKYTKPEKIVEDILKKNNIENYFQFFINDNGTCKSYDFKLKGKNILIEVDGDYWHGGPGCNGHFYDVENVKKNDKLKNEIALKHGYSVIHVWQSELKNNPNIILEKIKQYI